MKKKTYTSPESHIFEMEMEGVICASGGVETPVTNTFDSLQDYNPSEGAW